MFYPALNAITMTRWLNGHPGRHILLTIWGASKQSIVYVTESNRECPCHVENMPSIFYIDDARVGLFVGLFVIWQIASRVRIVSSTVLFENAYLEKEEEAIFPYKYIKTVKIYYYFSFP